MDENKVNEVEETKETKESVGEITVVEKEGFGTKIKNGAKKVFSSKPAKIVGGVVLAVGGAIVGYSYANRNRDDNDLDYEYDDEDFYDEEVPTEEESVEVAD